MKLNTLRYLDRKIGIPLCNFLYFFKKTLFLHRRKEFNKDKVKKILVIKIWGMGSIILASPLFENLRRNFPEAEIWFLTKDGFEHIYNGKFFNKIETIKLKGFFRAVYDFLMLVAKIRRNKFDLVIDLEIVARYTSLLSYLSGAKVKVGFEITGQNKDKLYDFKVLYHESKHISEMFLNTIKSLGIKTDQRDPSPPCISAGMDSSTVLGKHGGLSPYIVVNINASELAHQRRLAPDKFGLIIRNINELFPEYSIVLIGSKDEVEYVNNFKNNFIRDSAKVIDLSGKTKMGELFSVMAGASLVVSNDSGPAHIASSFGVPLVVFFGPESPAIYAPKGGEIAVFYSKIHCSPCISVYKDKKIKCQSNAKCLSDINIDEINKTIIEYLNKDKKQRNDKKS